MEKFCSEHSGIMAKIKQLCKSNDAQWKEINGMKKMFLLILTGLVLTLAGISVNLAFLLTKG